MSKDYERLCATSEAFVSAAMSTLMVKRLVRVLEFFRTVSLGSWVNKDYGASKHGASKSDCKTTS
jgi:hypothetical protein